MDMNLVALSAALTNWNSNVFGHVGKRKQALLAQIRGIDRYLTRCQWITKDLNTYYFRNQAKRRQKANSIFTLRREDNSWCTDQNELLGDFASLVDPLLDASVVLISDDEIRIALFDMAPTKALGVDSFHVLFF
ncbi:hypothetical protein V6N13_094066 [Hibiscus sabdariffa]